LINLGISTAERKEETCFVLDEIDVISSGDDNNLKELMKFVKQAEIQVVFKHSFKSRKF
jgi:hypothetical protein